MLLAVLTIMSVGALPAQAATGNDGLGYVLHNTPVYSDENLTNQIGTVYAYESFTIFDWNYNNNFDKVCHIEYSTSKGRKEGYIITNGDHTGYTCVTTVASTTTVYTGNDTQLYKTAGTVYAGENVVVIGEYYGWSYIEYNTTSGRKRGYVATSALTSFGLPRTGVWHGFYLDAIGDNEYIPGEYTVYSGPNTTYAPVGSISYETVRVHHTTEFIDGSVPAIFISYSVNGTSQRKAGWIVYYNA